MRHLRQIINRNKLLPVLFAATIAVGSQKASAQPVMGSWFKTSEIITHADGKAVNTFERMTRTTPCYAVIVHTFSAGGKMSEDASACSENMRKMVASIDQQTSWKVTGDKMELDIASEAVPMKREVFHLRFKNKDEMIWTFVYAENPTTPNPLKTKEITTTYRRK